MPKIRVLIVDQDDSNTLVAYLEKLGFIIETATSVTEAIDLMDIVGFDIVISEMPPKIDGLEILQHLQKQQKNIPVIIITADLKNAVDAERSGVRDFIFKPFNNEEMLQGIKNTLEYTKIEV